MKDRYRTGSLYQLERRNNEIGWDRELADLQSLCHKISKAARSLGDPAAWWLRIAQFSATSLLITATPRVVTKNIPIENLAPPPPVFGAAIKLISNFLLITKNFAVA